MPGSYGLDELHVRRSEHIEAPVSRVASHAWVVDPSTLDIEQPKKIAGADQVRVILLDELDVESVTGIPGHPAFGIEVASNERGRLASRSDRLWGIGAPGSLDHPNVPSTLSVHPIALRKPFEKSLQDPEPADVGLADPQCLVQSVKGAVT